MGQLIVSAAGAAIGATIGGPAGAAIGWSIGSVVGSILFPQHGPSPQLQDLKIQNSAYGQPIPWMYGMTRVAGNIIWAGTPTTNTQTQSVGKGGPKTTTTSYSLSFAVGLCEGPITGIQRIWANGKLIYDMSNPSDLGQITGSTTSIANFTFYPGDESQVADPIIESFEGVGNVPPNRGLAYVVFNQLDLSQWGSYIPSLSFEVIRQANYGAVASTQVTASFTNSSNSESFITNYSNGVAVAWAKGFVPGFGSSDPQALSQQLTAYGAVQYQPPWTQNSRAIPQTLQGSVTPGIDYTQPAALFTDGHYINQGGAAWAIVTGIPSLFDTPAPSVYWLNDAAPDYTFWLHDAGQFYVSYTDVATPLLFVDSTGLQTTQNDGNSNYKYILIGLTADFVYARRSNTSGAGPGSLEQYDRNLNHVATLCPSNSNISMTMPHSCGWVVNDSLIYLTDASGALYQWTSASGTVLPVPNVAASGLTLAPTNTLYAADGVFQYGTWTLSVPTTVTLHTIAPSFEATSDELSFIASDFASRAGLVSGQYDTSTLTDLVRGYAMTNHGSARDGLNPLMSTYFFDAVDSDGKIKFIRRGEQPVGYFYYQDLGADTSRLSAAEENPITEILAQELELPQSVTLTYQGSYNDYQNNSQRAVNVSTASNLSEALQAAVVFADGDALQRTQAALWSRWVNSTTFQFSTGLAYLQYEPGDVVGLQMSAGGPFTTVRIVQLTYDGKGVLHWAACLEAPEIYPAANSGASVAPGVPAGYATQVVGYSGPSILIPMDIPPLRDQDTTPGLYVAVCGLSSAWPGCEVDTSLSVNNFTKAFSTGVAAVMGYAVTALGNFSGGHIADELNAVTVQIYEGALSSTNYAGMLNGVCPIYLGGELIFYRTATQIAANQYTLTGLMRGMVGTEYAMSGHAAGEAFVLLTQSSLNLVSVPQINLGATFYFEAITLGLANAASTGPAASATSHACVSPLAPVLLAAAKPGTTTGSGPGKDIKLSWYRRARVSAQWVDGHDVILDESVESYTVTITNSTITVSRIVTGPFTATNAQPSQSQGNPVFLYTAAMQSTDGFSTGNTLTFSVAQNSDQSVAGTAATTTATVG